MTHENISDDEDDSLLTYFRMPDGYIPNRKLRAKLAHERRSKAAKERWKPIKKKKPRKEYLWDGWKGKGIKGAGNNVYQALADASIGGIIAGQTHALFRFPKEYLLPKGFPRGKKAEETDDYTTRNINLALLLDWLYNAGYAGTKSAELKREIAKAERRME